MRKVGFVIITGVSGSGKSTALRTLEDAGYYAVDNLPVSLLTAFAQLAVSGGAEISRAAMVMDIRERRAFDSIPAELERLRRMGHPVQVVFLRSSSEVLTKRFSETRRVHPLAPSLPLAEALEKELSLLEPLLEQADLVLDTSDMNPHKLRQVMRERFGGGEEKGERMLLTLISFGYKFGLPREADLVFDVRFLPNPFFVEGLRGLDGRDDRVASYVEGDEGTREFLERLGSFLEDLLPRYAGEGRGYLTLAVGCTGGQHRSVAVVERLARRLCGNRLVKVQVRHREIREG